jgi:hypothetical protein
MTTQRYWIIVYRAIARQHAATCRNGATLEKVASVGRLREIAFLRSLNATH